MSTTSQLNRPRCVLHGAGSSATVGDAVATVTSDRGTAVLVVDRAIMELSLANSVIETLEGRGWDVTVFDKVQAEPEVKVVEAVIETIEAVSARVVVGLGGGSALDLAKMGAAVARASDADLEAVLEGGHTLTESIPLLAIPTTAGTGAECTEVATLVRGSDKLVVRGRGLMPDIAVLDPTLTESLPRNVTAATGMDVLAHACEAYLSTNATALTDMYALAAVRMASGALERCCDGAAAPQDRERMLYAAHLAGTALNAGVVVGHSVAYTLAARTHLPHGVTTGIVLPYFLLYDRPGCERRLAELACAAVGRTDATDRDLIWWLADTIDAVGLPRSLEATGLDRGELDAMAAEVIELFPRPNNPLPLEHGRLVEFLNYAFNGDLSGANAASVIGQP